MLSSGLSFAMAVTTSYEMQYYGTDHLISAWVEDDTDFVTACFTYTDSDDNPIMEVHWLSNNSDSRSSSVALFSEQTPTSAKMSDSTTALVLLREADEESNVFFSLCTFDFDADSYSCFSSPDTFGISGNPVVKWMESGIAIGATLPYEFSDGVPRDIFAVYIGLEEADADIEESFELDDSLITKYDTDEFEA